MTGPRDEMQAYSNKKTYATGSTDTYLSAVRRVPHGSGFPEFYPSRLPTVRKCLGCCSTTRTRPLLGGWAVHADCHLEFRYMALTWEHGSRVCRTASCLLVDVYCIANLSTCFPSQIYGWVLNNCFTAGCSLQALYCVGLL